MPVEIDSMHSDVEILPNRDTGQTSGGVGYAGSPAAAQNSEQLKEVLRPLVMELISEELEYYMRMRG